MPNELSEKVYPDGTVVKLRDDAAREQIANVASGISLMAHKNISNSTEDDFLLSVFADIKADSNAYTTAQSFACINRIYTWSGHDHYCVIANRISTTWIYAFVYSYDRAYIIEYNCTNNSIAIKKTFTLT